MFNKIFFQTHLIHIFSIFIIVTISIIAYSNSFDSSFQFDDDRNIRDNPIIKDLNFFLNPLSAKKVIHNHTDPTSLYTTFKVRYIGYLTFALNYKFNGLDPTGYHIFNTAVHILSALFLYFLILLTLRTPLIRIDTQEKQYMALALFTSLFFAVHPVQTQAVTYIVQRLASLTTMFFLLSLLLYAKYRIGEFENSGEISSGAKTKSIILYLSALFFVICAMKTKETAFTLPIVIVLYEFIMFRGKIKKRIALLIPFLLTLPIIPLFLFVLDAPTGDVDDIARLHSDMSRRDYFFTQLRVILTYMRILFFPINQNVDYDYPISHTFFEPKVFLSFLLLFSLFVANLYLLFRYGKRNPLIRLASFGLLFFFITLSPESSIVPIRDVIFEHRLYLPSIGFFLAFNSFLFYLANRFSHIAEKVSFLPSGVVIVIVLNLLICFSLTFATIERNKVWKDEISLWEDIVKKSPGKARPHNNLGNAYSKGEYFERAAREFRSAIAIHPDYAEAWYNLGVILHEHDGKMDEAMTHYYKAIMLDQSHAKARNNYGLLLLQKGKFKEASKYFSAAISLKHDYAEALKNQGAVLIRLGRYSEAVQHFKKVLLLDSSDARVYNNLGIAMAMQGKFNEASDYFSKAVKIDPYYDEARINMERALKDSRE